ncbi:MAG: thioredoxin [Bacteroidales bacterium]|nr:thioredoxin [Bacteroidales bacterium]
MAKEFTDADVHQIIESGRPVVIDFWATWCGPCVGMTPIVNELAEEYEGRVEIGKYNIEEQNDLAAEYRIMSIPVFLFFKDGKQIRDLRLAGSQSKATLQANIEKLLAL